MNKVFYGLIFFLLWFGFTLLFSRARWFQMAGIFLRRSKEGMDAAARRRLLDNRKQLLTLQKKHSLWNRLEQEINYSGLKRYMPFLTAEVWLAGNILCLAVVSAVLLIVFGWRQMFLGIVVFVAVEYVTLYFCKERAFRSVNANLVKFLDFLGNYSITAGELTGIFAQISRYVDEPLRSVLEECSYEAKTTGDAGLALLAMAEKVEHPKFKELVRNMEISVRYSADFSLLVQNSRRMMREYLRFDRERNGMMREAVINMALLLGMSLFTLVIVNELLETSVWVLIGKTMPGRIALGVVAVILIMFGTKLAERR